MDAIVSRDLRTRTLPVGSRLCLERRALTVLREQALIEPPAKKPHHDDEGGECGGVEVGLVAYNGLREVMDNKTPLPQFWQLFRERETFLNTVLTVSRHLDASALIVLIIALIILIIVLIVLIIVLIVLIIRCSCVDGCWHGN